MVRKIKSVSNKKILILMTVAVLAATGGVVWFVNQGDESTTSQSEDIINYGPATEQEKQETEQHKQELENKLGPGNSSTPSSQPSSQASVVMTYANLTNQSVESGGFVSNALEEGGTCTLTLTKGSAKVTGTSQGFIDVNKTACPTISINRNQLNSGEWTVVLSYSSSSASGSSAPEIINVP